MNKLAKITVLTLLTIISLCCGSEKNISAINDNSKITEEQAIKIVFSLPEVQNIPELEAFPDGITDIEGNRYYCIPMMMDMETHFHACYHFFVPEKPDMEIKILDVFEDTIISLEQWRQNKKIK
jgi:hypothetical protein